MKTILSVLLLCCLADAYEYKTEEGVLSVRSENFVLKLDTTIFPEGDDVTWTEVKSNDQYLCSKQERPQTVAVGGSFRSGKSDYPVQFNHLYNLDSAHQNIAYLKFRILKGRKYLFAKMGPPACPYHVIWKMEKRVFRLKDMFQPVIESDVFLDEKTLAERLGQY